jgi:hypothetical protein
MLFQHTIFIFIFICSSAFSIVGWAFRRGQVLENGAIYNTHFEAGEI